MADPVLKSIVTRSLVNGQTVAFNDKELADHLQAVDTSNIVERKHEYQIAATIISSGLVAFSQTFLRKHIQRETTALEMTIFVSGNTTGYYQAILRRSRLVDYSYVAGVMTANYSTTDIAVINHVAVIAGNMHTVLVTASPSLKFLPDDELYVVLDSLGPPATPADGTFCISVRLKEEHCV